jgi:hypothetical protein
MRTPTSGTRTTIPILALLATVGLLAATVSCQHNPFADYAISAVELRSAPKLEFLRAHRGMKFLQVLFDFRNDSEETLVLRALDFSLRDSKGKHYPFSAQVLDMGQAFHTSESFLEPGQIKSGSVVLEMVFRFEVEGGLVVRFDEEQASLTENASD